MTEQEIIPEEKPRYQNEEWLRKEYIDEDKTTEKIADEQGVARGTIQYWLRGFEIKKRKEKHPYRNKAWLIEQNHTLGKSPTDIAYEYDINYNTLFSWFRRFDIKVIRNQNNRKTSIDGDLRYFIENYCFLHKKALIQKRDLLYVYNQFLKEFYKNPITLNSFTTKLRKFDIQPLPKQAGRIKIIYPEICLNQKGIEKYANIERQSKLRLHYLKVKEISKIKDPSNLTSADVCRKVSCKPLAEELKTIIDTYNSKRKPSSERINYLKAKKILKNIERYLFKSKWQYKFKPIAEVGEAIYLTTSYSQSYICLNLIDCSDVTLRTLHITLRDEILHDDTERWRHLNRYNKRTIPHSENIKLTLQFKKPLSKIRKTTLAKGYGGKKKVHTFNIPNWILNHLKQERNKAIIIRKATNLLLLKETSLDFDDSNYITPNGNKTNIITSSLTISQLEAIKTFISKTRYYSVSEFIRIALRDYYLGDLIEWQNTFEINSKQILKISKILENTIEEVES